MLDPQLLLSLLPPVPLNDLPVVKLRSLCRAALVGRLWCIRSLPRGHQVGSAFLIVMAAMRWLLAVLCSVAQHKGVCLCGSPETSEYHTQRRNEPLVYGLWWAEGSTYQILILTFAMWSGSRLQETLDLGVQGSRAEVGRGLCSPLLVKPELQKHLPDQLPP